MDHIFVIRTFIAFITSLYVYWRLLGVGISNPRIFAAIIFSFIMSIPLTFTLSLMPPFFELLFLGSACIFVIITARTKPFFMILGIILSIGIVLGIEMLSRSIVLLLFVLYELIHMTVSKTQLTDPRFQDILGVIIMIAEIIVFILTVAIVNFLFKTKRLKKGILFLQDKEAVLFGVFLSATIMINRSFPELIYEHTSSTGYFYVTIFTAVIVNICTFGIYFWWRHHTTTLYKQRIKKRDTENYISEIVDKDKQIKKLSESNALLSKMVHRDNKLIPAMYNAVYDFLSCTENTDSKTKGLAIRSELEEIIKERKNMILQVQREHKILPPTKIERIDNLLSYMLLKAGKSDIEFDFVLAGHIYDIAESIIPKAKLETLLADLIDNAIIATSQSTYRRILVTTGVVDDCLEISIQDSGTPFEIETLSNLGVKKHSTHVDTGGSGIGYMTIFEILNERSASIIITEYIPVTYAFSKSINIRFDGKAKYIIHSFRANEIFLPTERTNMFVFEYR